MTFSFGPEERSPWQSWLQDWRLPAPHPRPPLLPVDRSWGNRRQDLYYSAVAYFHIFLTRNCSAHSIAKPAICMYGNYTNVEHPPRMLIPRTRNRLPAGRLAGEVPRRALVRHGQLEAPPHPPRRRPRRCLPRRRGAGGHGRRCRCRCCRRHHVRPDGLRAESSWKELRVEAKKGCRWFCARLGGREGQEQDGRRRRERVAGAGKESVAIVPGYRCFVSHSFLIELETGEGISPPI